METPYGLQIPQHPPLTRLPGGTRRQGAGLEEHGTGGLGKRGSNNETEGEGASNPMRPFFCPEALATQYPVKAHTHERWFAVDDRHGPKGRPHS
jgi:hypothetical protein